MTPHLRLPLPARAAMAMSAFAVLSVTSLRAQQSALDATAAQPAPPSAESFAFEIGHAARTGATYSVTATQPATSKLTGQKVRLKIVETTGLDRNFHYFTLATGKHKTVAQLDAILVDVFQRFLGSPTLPSGQELGKIGDVQHGGEVRFVVTTANILRFENVAPGQPMQASNYSRDEIAGLLSALTGQPTS